MNKRNTLSIITINFNNEKGLQRTIDSVKAQSFKNYEWILIDSGSSDASISIIKNESEHFSYWCSEKDNGVYDAMNKGLQHCNSQWVLFLNSGDMLADATSLEEIFKRSYAPETGIVFGDSYDYFQGASKYRKPFPFYENPSYLHHKGICHQSSFTRTHLAQKYKFDTKFKIAADYKMFMDIYKDGYKLEYIPIAISRFEINVGISQTHTKLAFKEDAIILGRYNTPKYWYFYFKRFVYPHFKSVFHLK